LENSPIPGGGEISRFYLGGKTEKGKRKLWKMLQKRKNKERKKMEVKG
jgi:hypothetical protein